MAGKTVIISGPAACGEAWCGPFYHPTAGAMPGTSLLAMAGLKPGDFITDITPRDGRLLMDRGYRRLMVGPVALTNGRSNYRAWLTSGRYIDFVMEITDAAPMTGAQIAALSPSALAALCQLVP